MIKWELLLGEASFYQSIRDPKRSGSERRKVNEIQQLLCQHRIVLSQSLRDKYEEYLGVRPANDREGVLQDVHWTTGFGYFPTYALGNFYNAMYYNQMAKEIDIDAVVEAGRFDLINGWMRDHVFNIADRMAPSEWIRAITGRRAGSTGKSMWSP